MKSQEALAKMVSGVAKFQRKCFPRSRRCSSSLKHQQHPIATFFTCADSRILPAMLLQTGPGEIFTERTPGNIVPKYSDHVGGVTASMEYAVMVLRVPLIIICGHTDCGVMKALLEPEQTAGMPALQSWMRHALVGARAPAAGSSAKLPKKSKLRLLTEYNVADAIGESARRIPPLKRRWRKASWRFRAGSTTSAADRFPWPIRADGRVSSSHSACGRNLNRLASDSATAHTDTRLAG